tara:strand:+ start:1162 stop:1326 length:165 start_codon:yes stop_codon:yes gene_type:complete
MYAQLTQQMQASQGVRSGMSTEGTISREEEADGEAGVAGRWHTRKADEIEPVQA